MRPQLLLATLVLAFSSHAFSAVEYLRFEGNISGSYNEFSEGYDASLGFSAGQNVYFDFMIDTEMDAPGYADGPYSDNFAVTYLDGTTPGPTVTRGSTNTFPEGVVSWLYIDDSLRVGDPWESDRSIDDWSVGTYVSLLNNSYFSEYKIGHIQLTYRDSTPAPTYVPLPPAALLFLSGLGILSLASRRRIR